MDGSAPMAFQWFMQNCLGNPRDEFCAPYLDNIDFRAKESFASFQGAWCQIETRQVQALPK